MLKCAYFVTVSDGVCSMGQECVKAQIPLQGMLTLRLSPKLPRGESRGHKS